MKINYIRYISLILITICFVLTGTSYAKDRIHTYCISKLTGFGEAPRWSPNGKELFFFGYYDRGGRETHSFKWKGKLDPTPLWISDTGLFKVTISHNIKVKGLGKKGCIAAYWGSKNIISVFGASDIPKKSLVMNWYDNQGIKKNALISATRLWSLNWVPNGGVIVTSKILPILEIPVSFSPNGEYAIVVSEEPLGVWLITSLSDLRELITDREPYLDILGGRAYFVYLDSLTSQWAWSYDSAWAVGKNTEGGALLYHIGVGKKRISYPTEPMESIISPLVWFPHADKLAYLTARGTPLTNRSRNQTVFTYKYHYYLHIIIFHQNKYDDKVSRLPNECRDLAISKNQNEVIVLDHNYDLWLGYINDQNIIRKWNKIHIEGLKKVLDSGYPLKYEINYGGFSSMDWNPNDSEIAIGLDNSGIYLIKRISNSIQQNDNLNKKTYNQKVMRKIN